MKLYNVPMTTFASNCYILVSDSGNAAIIDPGADAQRISEYISKANAAPKMILLTHGHYDHIGAVAELKERFSVPVYAGKNDLDLIENPAMIGNSLTFRSVRTFDVDELVYEGLTIQLDELELSVIETPGHSKGSVCIICGEYLFSGDTLFRGGFGRTDLYGGDGKQLFASLKRITSLPVNYIVMPGHEMPTRLFTEKAFLSRISEGML